MKILAVAMALVLSWSAHAEAQRRCVRGIPCGNSCISASKICRKDQVPSVPARPAAQPLVAEPRVVGEMGDDGMPWVATAPGAFYYARHCEAARELPARIAVFFRTEEEAQRAGYSRSQVSGC
jgi:hypothetical protein